jgi:hypothetical protein
VRSSRARYAASTNRGDSLPDPGNAGRLVDLPGISSTWWLLTGRARLQTSVRFAMGLALLLGKAHTPPGRVNVAATVALDEVDGVPTIASSALRVGGQVPGSTRRASKRS